MARIGRSLIPFKRTATNAVVIYQAFPAGSITLAGTTVESLKGSSATVGVVTLSGMLSWLFVESPSGAVSLGGSAATLQPDTDQPAGTVTYGGSALEGLQHNANSQGTLTLGGLMGAPEWALSTLWGDFLWGQWISTSSNQVSVVGVETLGGSNVDHVIVAATPAGTITVGGSAVDTWGVLGIISIGGTPSETKIASDSPLGEVDVGSSIVERWTNAESVSGAVIVGGSIVEVFALQLGNVTLGGSTSERLRAADTPAGELDLSGTVVEVYGAPYGFLTLGGSVVESTSLYGFSGLIQVQGVLLFEAHSHVANLRGLVTTSVVQLWSVTPTEVL